MERASSDFERALQAFDRLEARRLVTNAGRHLSPMELVDQWIVPALTRIGEEWERGETSLAQVYMSGRICEEIVDTLLPPGDPQRKKQPPMAIAALNDYHLLGKRIVCTTLRAAGYDLRDYGQISVSDVVRRAQADRLRVLLLSTLMLNSALRVREVVDQLRTAKAGVKVIVGGAPFLYDSALSREVGADAMGRSAADAVELVQGVLGGRS